MSTTLNNWLVLGGRILLSLIFLLSGVNKIFDFEETTKYMVSEGMKMVPVTLVGAIIIEVAGALCVMSGFQARFGALLLAIFLVTATLIFHDFWTLPEEAQQMQMIMFMKNLAILGGLLVVIGHGPGEISVDARLNNRQGT